MKPSRPPRGALDSLTPPERRRWRLITGPGAEDGAEDGAGKDGAGQGGAGQPAGKKGAGQTGGGKGPVLTDDEDRQRDRCLELVYGHADGFGYPGGNERRPGQDAGGGGSPAPYVPRWLEDLRRGFPRSVVEQVQKEALSQRGWERLILEPENLATLKHDAYLVSALLALKDLVPDETKSVARAVVAEVVRKLEQEIRMKVMRALSGRASPTRLRRDGPATRIDWPRTIRGSMKHYQPDLETLVPDPVLFRDSDRRQFDDRHVILLVDQSGSMATSLVYAAVMGSVLASLKNLSTKLMLFDDHVVDVSDQLSDPVEVLFGAQLGGGTSIRTALLAAQPLVVEPRRTLLVLVSDLEEGDDPRLMMELLRRFRDEGVSVLCLLGLDMEAVPMYSRDNARAVAALGIPAFACTPDKFVDVMRCVMDGRGLSTVGINVPTQEDR